MHCRVNTALTRQYSPITGHLNCVSYPQSNMSETLSVTSKRLQEHEWVRGLTTCQAMIRSDKHHNYCHSCQLYCEGKGWLNQWLKFSSSGDQYHCQQQTFITLSLLLFCRFLVILVQFVIPNILKPKPRQIFWTGTFLRDQMFCKPKLEPSENWQKYRNREVSKPKCHTLMKIRLIEFSVCNGLLVNKRFSKIIAVTC